MPILHSTAAVFILVSVVGLTPAPAMQTPSPPQEPALALRARFSGSWILDEAKTAAMGSGLRPAPQMTIAVDAAMLKIVSVSRPAADGRPEISRTETYTLDGQSHPGPTLGRSGGPPTIAKAKINGSTIEVELSWRTASDQLMTKVDKYSFEGELLVVATESTRVYYKRTSK